MLTPKSFSITGSGAVITLESVTGTHTKSRWVQLQAQPGNSHVCLTGGPEVAWASDTNYTGFAIPSPYGGDTYPPVSDDKFANFYEHSKIYLFVAAGDKLNGLYGG